MSTYMEAANNRRVGSLMTEDGHIGGLLPDVYLWSADIRFVGGEPTPCDYVSSRVAGELGEMNGYARAQMENHAGTCALWKSGERIRAWDGDDMRFTWARVFNHGPWRQGDTGIQSVDICWVSTSPSDPFTVLSGDELMDAAKRAWEEKRAEAREAYVDQIRFIRSQKDKPDAFFRYPEGTGDVYVEELDGPLAIEE